MKNEKNSNSTDSTVSIKKKDTPNIPSPLSDGATSLWVRNFVAFSNSFPNFGKGLCWLFFSLILVAIIFFILMGNITSDDILKLVTAYLENK